MFGFNNLINVRIRDFEPLTDNNNTIERKNTLLEKIRDEINLEEAKKKMGEQTVFTKSGILSQYRYKTCGTVQKRS